jgi:hypothetical protein
MPDAEQDPDSLPMPPKEVEDPEKEMIGPVNPPGYTPPSPPPEPEESTQDAR